MGRRPNQLIVSNFIRGPKLGNSTNRYVQTCRGCGAEFPKGRIESLTRHLLKECPAGPVDSHAQSLSDFPPHAAADDPSAMALAVHHPAPALPFGTKQSMSALEALAEVSRQHLDFNTMRTPHSGGGGMRLPSPNGYSPDDFLVSDDKPTAEEDTTMSSGNQANSTTASPLPPMQFNGPQSPVGSPHLPGLALATGTTSATHMVPSPLQLAASAATELLIPAGGPAQDADCSVPNSATSDRPFTSPRHTVDWSIDPLLQNSLTQQSPNGDSSVNRATHFRRLAINPSSTGSPGAAESGSEARPTKPKVRGRFTDSRRKEVQEVRKRGACIRCRMLKKPCSGESPCSTCRNVESARLWKQPCIRTRVADEFDLYAAGLHSVLAFHQINQAKLLKEYQTVDRRIVASHFPDFSVSAVFASLESKTPGSAEPADHLNGNSDSTRPAESSCMIDTNAGVDMVGEVQKYMQKLVPHLIKVESSPFVRLTLQQAFAMNGGEKPDNLISNILELWVATAILTDSQLKFNLARPRMATGQSENPESSPLFEQITDADSIACIDAQLRGVVEKRAILCAKFVMNELERRLLQRQQANPFETFIVAILLLSCTERMCWLFKTWEVNDGDQQFSHEPASAGGSTPAQIADPMNPSTPNGIPESPTLPLGHPPLPASSRWPLDKPPHHYYQKGERFSDIVQMLLRMRGVPPKTTTQLSIIVNSSGLSQPGENLLQAIAPSAGSIAQNDITAAQEWFHALGISIEEIHRRRESRWAREDCKSWEGKFVSKILRIA